MSKHGEILLLIALAGCKYAALPQLSGRHDDAANIDASNVVIDGAGNDATPIDAATCPATSTCVEAAMPGWNGPAVFYEGATTGTPPACSGAFDVTALALNGGLDGGNPTCTCGCGAPTATSCGSATLGDYLDSACAAIRSSGPVSPNTCGPLGGTSNYYRLDAPNVTGGSCTASLTKSLPAATWTTQFRACTSSQSFPSAGCAVDQVCAPLPSAPFDSQICIYATGDVACPSGSSYANRIIRYASYSDTRGCSTCSCGVPTGSCGGGLDIRTSTSQGCFLAPKAHLDASACEALTLTGSELVEYVPAPAATCAPSTGTVTGTLSPTGPTTFCCLTP